MPHVSERTRLVNWLKLAAAWTTRGPHVCDVKLVLLSSQVERPSSASHGSTPGPALPHGKRGPSDPPAKLALLEITPFRVHAGLTGRTPSQPLARSPSVCICVCTLDLIVGPSPPIPRATPSGSRRADLSSSSCQPPCFFCVNIQILPETTILAASAVCPISRPSRAASPDQHLSVRQPSAVRKMKPWQQRSPLALSISASRVASSGRTRVVENCHSHGRWLGAGLQPRHRS